jgi:hypothetical protein
MVIDYGLWNAAVSTLTLLIVATTAFVGCVKFATCADRTR